MHYLHDEIDELKELHAAGRLRLVLVDHNHVVPLLADFTQNIVRIIDHHKQVEPVTVPTTCETRIELVGSCSSLVAAHCERKLGFLCVGIFNPERTTRATKPGT